MLRCWSSLPDARNRPDVDQLNRPGELPFSDFQIEVLYLRALTQPEWPPSSFTTSRSRIQLLSPYMLLTLELFGRLPFSLHRRRSHSVSLIVQQCSDLELSPQQHYIERQSYPMAKKFDKQTSVIDDGDMHCCYNRTREQSCSAMPVMQQTDKYRNVRVTSLAAFTSAVQ